MICFSRNHQDRTTPFLELETVSRNGVPIGIVSVIDTVKGAVLIKRYYVGVIEENNICEFACSSRSSRVAVSNFLALSKLDIIKREIPSWQRFTNPRK